jgi:alpha-amylase
VGNTWLQQDVSFRQSEPATLWRFSIETVTGSEAGFERTHQGSCCMMIWNVVLEAGEKWEVEIDIEGHPSTNYSIGSLDRPASSL